MLLASASEDVPRLRGHFVVADELLARADRARARPLDPVRRATRALLREALGRYRRRGRFPANLHARAMRPTFIDDFGTRCAMAHLMELGGASALVAEIARTANHAYIPELATDARVRAWLDAAGLTVGEAAAIQPSYTATLASECLCRVGNLDGNPQNGVWIGTMVDATHARVEAVHANTGTLAVGDVVEVADVGSGASMVLFVGTKNGDAGTFASAQAIASMDAIDLLGSSCIGIGSYAGTRVLGPLSRDEVFALADGTHAQCPVTLAAIDPCWTSGASCTYAPHAGAPARESPATTWPPSSDADSGTDSGAASADAGSTGVAAGSSSPDASSGSASGCTTTGAPPDSLAVLLALAGALAARSVLYSRPKQR